MFCTGCGIALADDTRSCNSCGTDVTGTRSVSVVAGGFGAGKFRADKPAPEKPAGKTPEAHDDEGSRRDSGGGVGGAGGYAAAQAAGVPAGNRAEALIGRVLDAKYRLEGIIGAGGMGTVYRATRLMIGDTVAIKIMHSEFVNDDEAERFRREAQAAARLKHPNAVRFTTSACRRDGWSIWRWSWSKARALRAIIKAQGSLAYRRGGEIMQSDLCAALDEAHAAHIVHRDLKPDNIIVARSARGVRVKVLDFRGRQAARCGRLRANLTQTGSMMGTPHYMSPEQRPAKTSTDVPTSTASASCSTRCWRASSRSIRRLRRRSSLSTCNQPPPSLGDKHAGINPATERAVRRALEKKREARPQTAGTLADELVESLSTGFVDDAAARAGAVPAAATNAYGASFGPDSAGDLTVVKDVETDSATGAGDRGSAQTVVLAAASSGASGGFTAHGLVSRRRAARARRLPRAEGCGSSTSGLRSPSS